jgi:hypothetical protein
VGIIVVGNIVVGIIVVGIIVVGILNLPDMIHWLHPKQLGQFKFPQGPSLAGLLSFKERPVWICRM